MVAEHDLDVIIADLPNAYCSAERRRPPTYMHLPKTCPRHDAAGRLLCIRVVTPIYGEEASGDELEATVGQELEQIGWQQSDVCPAMHTIPTDGAPILMLRIVDESSPSFQSRVARLT